MGPDDVKRMTREQLQHFLGQDFMQLFNTQLLLVLLDRMGGEVTIPVAEVDAAGKLGMTLCIDQDGQTFTLILQRVQ